MAQANTIKAVRRLLYVPVIHTAGDLGSVAPEIEKRSQEIYGRDRWERHKQVITRFWDGISSFFDHMDAGKMVIYQDGLAVGGHPAQKIIHAGAAQGSRNYQIVLRRIQAGARIRQTEDPDLLKQEYVRILQLAERRSVWEQTITCMGHASLDDQGLLARRDQYIAMSVNRTLKKDETGVIFIGAFHRILPLLDADIRVWEVKKQEKVNAYFRSLLPGGNPETFEQLAAYMVEAPAPWKEIVVKW